MKRLIPILIILSILLSGFGAFAKSYQKNEAENEIVPTNTDSLNIKAESYALMEASSGKILLSHNEGYFESPASVTKIMTLLLVCEALELDKYKLTDSVVISEYAASMGGSQVFLKEGERMTVEELLKCTVIASANDAAVALAELTEGTESAFVAKMNKRARELGLKKTSFENVTGLDDTTVNHYSCAADIAIMSRELIKYDIITKYASLWQDSIRNGEFILTNTNRLVRFYDGCNGLKTGSTDKAGYCVSVTAKRGNMQLIAVIMNAPSITERNNSARALLDYGFSNYAVYSKEAQTLEKVPVLFGKENSVEITSGGFSDTVPRSDAPRIEEIFDIPENLTAPIKKGDVVGSITYMLDGKEIGKIDICADVDIERITYLGIVWQIFKNIFV